MKCKRCKGDGRLPKSKLAFYEYTVAFSMDIIMDYYSKDEAEGKKEITGMCPACRGSGHTKK